MEKERKQLVILGQTHSWRLKINNQHNDGSGV
jgi:hypothetical protein